MPKALAHHSVEGNPPVVYPIKDAGVDWLTVTCREGETKSRFDELGYSLLHVESELGGKIVPWNFERFEGLNAGQIAMGQREDLSMIRMSSACAWSNWRRAFELATNCSRIDLQVTFREVPEVDALILESHKAALDHANARKRPTEVDLRLSNRRGPTLYLGVRQSTRFGRLYNKFRESKLTHYEGCVRAEMQVNGKGANFCGRALLQSSRSPDAVIPYVSSFFLSRGIRPCWPYKEEYMFHIPRSRSNAGKRLTWLRTQVAPAVQQLISDGHFDATIEALGLVQLLDRELDHQQKIDAEME